MVGDFLTHWTSILFYFLIFLFSAILLYIGSVKQNKRPIRVALVVSGLAIPVIVSGIRYNVGKDYFNYVGMLNNVSSGKDVHVIAIEPLSELVIRIAATVDSSAVMFTLFSAITIVFIYLALKSILSKPGSVALGYFLYLCIVFPTTFNAVRSGVAVSIIAYAFSRLLRLTAKYRLFEFIAWVSLASMFHVSALACLPIGLAVYFIGRELHTNKKWEVALWSGSVLLAVIFPLFGELITMLPIDLLQNYSRYFREVGDHFYVPIVGLVMLSALIVTFFINREAGSKDTRIRLLYSVAAYYVPMAIVVGWLSYYTGTSRLLFYLDTIIIAIIAYTVTDLKGRAPRKPGWVLLAVSIVMLFAFTLLVRNLNWAHALNYDTIFYMEAIDESKN